MVKRRRKGPVYRNKPPKQVPKSINRAAIAGGLLFFALVIMGFIYTYFSDQNASVPDQKAVVSTAINDAIRPPAKPSQTAPVGVAVESFDSLAYIGSQTTISAKTNPDAHCKIEVLYDNVDAVDPGLAPKTADDFGTVTWTWTISPAAPIGFWPVTITCANQAKSGVVQVKLSVTKPL